MFPTRFTELVGCEVPIQLAPMGQVVTPELAAAVTGAGGHAMLGLTSLDADAIRVLLDRAEALGAAPVGGNILVPFIDPEVLEFAASRVPLLDFYLGAPDPELVRIVHAAGALAGWQATSAEEAEAAEAAGCDLVVAHGAEAGGRNPGGIALLPLLAQVLDRVRIPVIAAGGIGTGRGIAAALAAGADAVRLGTRFVAAAESGAHPDYVAALIAASPEDTMLTDAYSLMFPPHLHGSRVLRSAVDAAEAATSESVGEMVLNGQTMPIPRFAPFPPLKGMTGNIAAMSLYAGQSVGAVRRVQPAAEIMAEFVADAERSLERGAPAVPR